MIRSNLFRKLCKTAAGAAIGVAPMLGGCALVGAVAYQVHGPAKIPAQYVPPKAPTLILVESFGNAGIIEASDEVARQLTEIFKKQKIAPTVAEGAIEKLRDEQPQQFDRMTVDAIGRRLGARQVLYVNVTRSDIEVPSGGSEMRGVMTARVRFVDAVTGETKWPTDSSVGDQVNVTTDWLQNDNPAAESEARNHACHDLADAIGKLFYKYQPKSDMPEHINAQ